ncbi:unnamed protein product [Merluccius merluccius]
MAPLRYANTRPYPAPNKVPCPKGAQVDQVGQRCYWLSGTGSSWSEARDACRESGSGDLAAVDGPQLQRFIHNSFPICCSAVPLCNTTGGCALTHYWCHLLEACVSVVSPCSPYDQTPASSARKFTVYPDDVLAIQHTRDSGKFLHCPDSEPSFNSPWRQSYLSLRSTESAGWWEGGLSSPPVGGHWVDEVVCNLRVLYVDSLPGKSHDFPNTHDIDDLPDTQITTDPDIDTPSPGPTTPLKSILGLVVIHPQPDDENQLHVQINIPVVIVIRIWSGGPDTSSSWSAPVLQTGVPFRPLCPEDLTRSWIGCERESPDTWFSSVTFMLPSAGVYTLDVSAVNSVSTQSVTVRVWGYEAVTGLSVEPHGHLRVLTGLAQSFTAKVETGSSVEFTWVMDHPEALTSEGDSCSVVLRKAAEYTLKVTAANLVSSQTQDVFLTADVMAPLADPEFLSVRAVVAVADTHLYTARVKVDIALGVNFSIESFTLVKVRPRLTRLLLSSSPAVTSIQRPFLLEAEVQPSASGVSYTWNFTDGSPLLVSSHGRISRAFGSVGLYNITVRTDNGVSALVSWLAVEVAEEVTGLTLSSNGPSELNSVTEIRGQVDSGTNVVWVFDFGDETPLGRQPLGVYQVTVIAQNPAVSHSVTVQEAVSGLTLDLQVQNVCTDDLVVFTPLVSSGTNVSYVMTFAERELNYGLIFLKDRFVLSGLPVGLHVVTVKAWNLVSSADVSSSVLAEGIFTGYIVKILAKVSAGSNLQFHWHFGDSSEVLVTDNNTASHTYHTPGEFEITVNVSNNVSQVSAQIHVEVSELQCIGPQAVLVQSHPTILRSSPSYFEAVVDVKNCSAYKAAYLWEIFRRSEDDSSVTAISVNLRSKVSVTSPLLSMPGWTLEVGQYDLVFTVSLHGSPLRIHREAVLTVAHSSLVAVIKGGSIRLWPSLSDLILDGSESRDPDTEPGTEDQLEYHWVFTDESSQPPQTEQRAELLPVPLASRYVHKLLSLHMQLFPGLWFSHAGTLVSVEMTVQPSSLPSLARVQILRPYCSPTHHLIPPGCSPLLNPFSCCSAVPLCNTTGGCALTHYWCHLLEACVSVVSPCSPYDQTPASSARFSYSLPPRYPATPPFFHLVADLPLRMETIRELTTVRLILPDRKFTVYPDDVLAIQHTRDSGKFLHCPDSEPSFNSPWRQSYLSLRSTESAGWWEGGLSSPPVGGHWVDEVVCNLRVLYVDSLPGKSHDFPNTHDIDDLPDTQITTDPDIDTPSPGPTTPLKSILGLVVIHPQPDDENQLHVQINIPVVIVIRIWSGGPDTSSSWSAPVLQTGVPFRPLCPEDLTRSWIGCERESPDTWFSSVTFMLPSAGVYTLDVSAVNSVSTQSVTVRVWGYEAVTGLSVEPHGHLRVLTGLAQSFTAKVETGSSVEFTWVMDHPEALTSEGDSCSVVLRKAAEYTLKVTAANLVSSQTQDVFLTADVMAPLADPEFLSVRAVVAVADTHLYTARVKVDIALGVNFSWSFGDNSGHVSHTHPAPCQTTEGLVERGERQVYVQDSISHAYLDPADYTLQVHVSNPYDSIESFTLVKVRPRLTRLLLSSSPAVTSIQRPFLLEAEVQPSASGVSYTWNFTDGSPLLVSSHGRISRAFGSVGLYNITVRTDNGVSALVSWLAVEVAEEVTGLTLSSNGPSELNSVTEIRGQVDSGTNVVWVFDFGDETPLGRQPLGVYQVTVIAQNPAVSHSVTVQEAVSGLTLDLQVQNVCTDDLVVFTPLVSSGTNVSYVMTFAERELNYGLIFLKDRFVLSGLPVGLHVVTVKAWNLVSSADVSSSVLAEGIFTGYIVKILAKVSAGSNLQFHWHFGDSSEVLVTDNNTASHTYHTPGEFEITVNVSNNVSQVSAQIHVEVSELQCIGPQAVLVQSHPTILRSSPSYFEAVVDVKNCSAYKAAYLWEIFRRSEDDSSVTAISVNLRSKVSVTSPLLSMPGWTLEVGQYDLVFTVSLHGSPLRIHREAVLTVAHSSLVAVIKGGSIRLWPSLSDLILDGSESRDPDTEPGTEDQLEYHWVFTDEVRLCHSTACDSPCQHIDRNSSQMTVPGNTLHRSGVYVFTLTVHKAGRRAVSTTQTVRVCEAETVFPVSVDCVSCSSSLSSVFSSSRRVSYGDPLVLSGLCEQCDNHAQYNWSAEDQNGSSLDLDEVTTSTGGRSPDLAVRPGVLREGRSYTFTLNTTQPDRWLWGSASLTIAPHPSPHGGNCVLLPETDIHPLETEVSYNCSGWKHGGSEGSQLIYTFQVALCRSSPTTCPLLTLYRGTRSTFGTVVPAGEPEPERDGTVITITVLVEDQLGAKVVALNRSLTVEHPRTGTEASDWLRNKSQIELWVLVQHGNPQEIVAYSLALASHLNQVEARGSNGEPWVTREIRANVTRSLASLPVSTVQDVDQVSSALTQSTAVSGKEPWCAGCQQQVLEAVGRMVHVMEEHKSIWTSSVLHTGRSILHLIDNILTATSWSPEVSSSDVTRPAAALAALGYARALVRSLMRPRVRGEEPLALNTPHIATVGFHGNPSELLCAETGGRPTRQNSTGSVPVAAAAAAAGFTTHASCRFQIPRSLAEHLANQSAEVVQILLGLDDPAGLAAADPPISTAVVAMELSTPRGQPISVRDLSPERAIRITLPSRHPGVGNGSRSVFTLPTEGWVNLTVRAVDTLDGKAGLYLSLNFSLVPAGTGSVGSGAVRVEVSPVLPGPSPLVRELSLSLSNQTDFIEESIFLSPLLNGTEGSLSVSLKSSLEAGGGPIRASACVFSSLCQYYSVTEGRWSSDGLRPLESSTLHSAHCLTRHLTMFGASLFVHPGAVVLLPPSGGPVRNVSVGIVCAVLVVIHLLLGLIAHKLAHLEGLRLGRVPLCGPAGTYNYRVLVKTGWRQGAGTTAHVGVCLYGVTKSGARHLQRDGAFQRGGLDHFHLETPHSLGEVWKIRLWHDNTGLEPSWYVQQVVVWDPQTDHMFFFLVEDWLSVESQTNGTVEKQVLASCPEELSGFRRVLCSQLLFGATERHLWMSVWTCPTHSTFTRGQRVTCGALLLHLYMALAAVWYGAVGTGTHSGPISADMMLSAETVAVGMTVSVLVFPLQCVLCFLFRKIRGQVTLSDLSVPPSPVCHSVEMDVYLGQSPLSGPSFLSLSDTSHAPGRDSSPSSLLGSKAFDSGILEFWEASGLTQPGNGGGGGRGHLDRGALGGWPSCDSLAELTLSGSTSDATFDPCSSTFTPELLRGPSLSCTGPARLLRRKKGLTQLCLAPADPTPSAAAAATTTTCPAASAESAPIGRRSPAVRACPKPLALYPYLTTSFLTQSEENLLRSINTEDPAEMKISASTSDSGRCSPRPSSSSSCSSSCSSFTNTGPETWKPAPWSPSPGSLYRCPSGLSLHSVASTFLPSPSPDSLRSPSATRIGVVRGQASWLLPAWALRVIYPLVAVVLAASLACAGLYGSLFPRAVLLMWLVSVLSAFLTSALLLEPLKVCAQALFYTALWRPVDAEVEDLLSRGAAVRRPEGEPGDTVRPPCGYGLLQAREVARKVRALRSLMKHCVWQLLFLLLVLLVNYQSSPEEGQGRLLRSAVQRALHAAPTVGPNLTSLKWQGTGTHKHTHTHTHMHGHTLPTHVIVIFLPKSMKNNWPDAWRWMDGVLVPHLHQNLNPWPGRLVGLPRLRVTPYLGGATKVVPLGNGSGATRQLLAELSAVGGATAQFRTLSVDFTQYHRETGLLVCVCVQLEWSLAQSFATSLSIHPLIIPPASGPHLQLALTVLLFTSALLFLAGEMRAMATERAQYILQGWRWLQLCVASLSLATAMLQLKCQSQASTCVQKLRSTADIFVDFHSVALLAARSSQLAAVLLTLLLLKLLGTLRFVRRWVLICRALVSVWREMGAVVFLLLLLLMLCAHIGHVAFSVSTEGFGSLRQAGVSALSLLRGRVVLRRLCGAHPVLGPLYALLLTGGGLWVLARLCGAVLIRNYRTVRAEMYRPAMEPQDYEMVEFFIKRLKLWMGLTKAKEFRHRVKFEGMGSSPSRGSSGDSPFAPSPSVSSPRPPSSLSSSPSSPSALSLRSEDSCASLVEPAPAPDVQLCLDRLLPAVDAMLSGFESVNRVTEEIHCLEVNLEEAQSRARERRRISLPSSASFDPSALLQSSPSARPRHFGVRLRNSCSESYSAELSSSRFPANLYPPEAVSATPPGAHLQGPPGVEPFPRRRAWHSGSSHSANAALRVPWASDGSGPVGRGGALASGRPRSEEGVRGFVSDGAPIKRKAWISDGPEDE